nr:hypothetical protein MmNV_22 [Menippe mercenaria nudivirus]
MTSKSKRSNSSSSSSSSDEGEEIQKKHAKLSETETNEATVDTFTPHVNFVTTPVINLKFLTNFKIQCSNKDTIKRGEAIITRFSSELKPLEDDSEKTEPMIKISKPRLTPINYKENVRTIKLMKRPL